MPKPVYTPADARQRWSAAVAPIVAGVLFVARSVLTFLAEVPPSSGEDILRWAHDHRVAIALTNECLMIGGVLLIPTAIALYRTLGRSGRLGPATGCAILAAVAPVAVVLGAVQGRLVYPVYGMELRGSASAELVTQIFYGGEHAMLLMVAAAATFIALSSPVRWSRLGGFAAAAGAVAAAYPTAIGAVGVLIANASIGIWISSLGWLIIRGGSQAEQHQ